MSEFYIDTNLKILCVLDCFIRVPMDQQFYKHHNRDYVLIGTSMNNW